VLWRHLRTPVNKLPEHGCPHPGWLFAIPYVLMFVINYVPRFFSGKEPLALGILLAIHGINFTLGLGCYWLIQTRVKRRRQLQPTYQPLTNDEPFPK